MKCYSIQGLERHRKLHLFSDAKYEKQLNLRKDSKQENAAHQGDILQFLDRINFTTLGP